MAVEVSINVELSVSIRETVLKKGRTEKQHVFWTVISARDREEGEKTHIYETGQQEKTKETYFSVVVIKFIL